MKYRVITAAAVLTAAAVCIGALTLVFYRHAQVEKWMEKPLSLPDSFFDYRPHRMLGDESEFARLSARGARKRRKRCGI